MRQEAHPAHGFDWQAKILLRRSPLMGRDAAPYQE
jgi:hypothetical protein